MIAQHRVLFVLILFIASVTASAQGTRLLRHPTVSRELVAFEYASDIWAVSRNGGEARRLTATPAVEFDPYFSPDGSKIAFSATTAGNTDVYVMATAGGDPMRLTYHPGIDRVRGWSPDGRRILFSSPRISEPQEAYNRLWTVDVDGEMPEPLPMPRGYTGVYSPDGGRLAVPGRGRGPVRPDDRGLVGGRDDDQPAGRGRPGHGRPPPTPGGKV